MIKMFECTISVRQRLLLGFLFETQDGGRQFKRARDAACAEEVTL